MHPKAVCRRLVKWGILGQHASMDLKRTVHEADVLTWLAQNPIEPGTAVVASLPDVSEFPKLTLAQWKEWWVNTCRLILSHAPAGSPVIFYQRDVKRDGEWIDKAYLCQKAAELEGSALLWHKIVARAPALQVTFGKPGYSHLLCFSKTLRLDLSQSSADLLPEAGESTWTRGMGEKVCTAVLRFLKDHTQTHTVLSLFCGEGALLAAANAHGFAAIGVERSRKRAEKARELAWEKTK